MFHNRPCGCKGVRSCLHCEDRFGAWNTSKSFTDDEKTQSLVFCPLCQLAWPGWGGSSWKSHPNHQGSPVEIPGLHVVLDFISEDEETLLMQQLDEVPWDVSQSGRLKQNYGPKCNFKKRKVKLDGFTGYPQFTKFIQDRFKDVELLKDFHTVEQCSLDYPTERGASIDPHIDDCWIWGERIPTLSLLCDSVLTLTKYSGEPTRYNLEEVKTYPRIINDRKEVQTVSELKDFYTNSESSLQNCNLTLGSVSTQKYSELPNTIRLPMPRRSLMLIYGEPRYLYEHSILREDLPERRVCITYRELTPTYLACGGKADKGREILEIGRQFWDHKEVYKEYLSASSVN